MAKSADASDEESSTASVSNSEVDTRSADAGLGGSTDSILANLAEFLGQGDEEEDPDLSLLLSEQDEGLASGDSDDDGVFSGVSQEKEDEAVQQEDEGEAVQEEATDLDLDDEAQEGLEGEEDDVDIDTQVKAERVKSDIQGAEDVFAGERGEFEESYIDKHYRHQRNKAKKDQLREQESTGARTPGQKIKARRRAKALYKAEKENSPDKQRRIDNANLKKQLQVEHGGKESASQASGFAAHRKPGAHEKAFNREYAMNKKHATPADRKVAMERMEKHRRNHDNKAELDSRYQGAGVKPSSRQGGAIRKQFNATDKELDEKGEKKRSDKQRKGRNKELKQRFLDQDQTGGSRAEKKASKNRAMKAYRREKEYKGGREEYQAKQDESARKQGNQGIKAQMKEEHGLRWRGKYKEKKQYTEEGFEKRYDKERKRGNRALKRRLKREKPAEGVQRAYRNQKVHRRDVDETKTDKDAGYARTAGSVISGVGSAGKGGSSGVGSAIGQFGTAAEKQDAGGMSVIMQSGGNQLGPMNVADTAQHMNANPTDNKLFSYGGNVQKAQGVGATLAGAGQMVSAGSAMKLAVDKRKDADSANREAAQHEVIDGVFKLANATGSTATGAQKTVQAFAATQQLAGEMALEAIPITGIVTSSAKMLQAGKDLGMAADRARQATTIQNKLKDEGDLGVAAAVKGLKNADIKLIASASVDLLIHATNVAANALTMAGPLAPVGATLKTAMIAVSGVKSAAMVLTQHFQDVHAKKKQVAFHDSVKENKSDGDQLKAGKNLLKTNLKYGVQVIINRAREGEGEARELALDYLGLFGLDSKKFDQMKDENIRAHIMGRLQATEEPETLIDKIRGAPGKLRGIRRAIKNKTGVGRGIDGKSHGTKYY